MTKRTALKKHLLSLGEIENIINAMKNLSLMEINTVSKFLITENYLVNTLKDVIADFFAFHRDILQSKSMENDVEKLYILVGSERGFCGNFNELIIKNQENLINNHNEKSITIAIGNKLVTKLTGKNIATININGANITEEIRSVVLLLMQELNKIISKKKSPTILGNWIIIFNEESDYGIKTLVFKPFADFGKNIETTKKFSNPPLLYLDPEKFLTEFMDQYLFAILHQVFYASFLIENRQRLKHMEGALDWLKNKNNALKLKFNELRQEEITEEIEVVMLSAEAILQENL